MAYTTSKTSALQTAIKASVDIGLALLNAGILSSREELDKTMGEYQEMFTAQLYPLVDADNVLAQSQPKYPPRSNAGGARSSGGGNGGAFTPEEAADTVLNFSAFKGLTLGTVYHMTADEATAYSASQGKTYSKAGIEWLRWAAKETAPERSFIAKRAQAVLDNPPPA